VYIAVLVLMSMSSLIRRFSSHKKEILVWKYCEAEADTRKSKGLVTVSKGKTCCREEWFFIWNHTYSEQFRV